jgi:hypothetical protein
MAAMKTPAPHCGALVGFKIQQIEVTYALLGALAAEALDLAVTVNLVVLEHSQLGPVTLLASCLSRDEIRDTHFLRLCLIFLGVV